MKKNLFAVAALSVCGLAQAQSSVTLYGIVDAYVESVRVTGQATQTKLSSGGLAPSRWGMRGEEDLGGGLKASFKLESGFALDNGTAGRAFSRAAHVGLSSPTLGEVRLGRQDSTMLDSMVWTDTDYASNFSAVTPLLLNNLDHLRQDNMLSYTTPNFAGFDGRLTFAPGENTPLNAAATVTARNKTGALLRYKDGPVLATLALHHGGQNTATGATKQDAVNAAVRYDLGMATLSGSYYQHRNSLASGLEPKMQGAVVGVFVPQGAWGFIAQYGYAWDNGQQYATGADKSKGKTQLINVGAHYNLSKRTMIYTRAAYAKDEGGGFNGRPIVAAFGIAGELNTLATGGSARTVGLGILHRF